MKFLLVLSIALLAACNSGSNQKKNSLYGIWAPEHDPSKTIKLVINANNMYQIHFTARNEIYGGVYDYSGGVIKFTDTYCGSKFTGTYKYNQILSKVSFTMIDDSFCGRKTFFPGEWKRISNNEKDVISYFSKYILPVGFSPQSRE